MKFSEVLNIRDGSIIKIQFYLEKFIDKKKYILLPKNKFISQIIIFIYLKFLRKIIIFFHLISNMKLIFAAPEKKKNIILDGSMDHYTKFLIKKNNFYNLETRINRFKKIYITKKLIFYLIKNFKKNSLKINYLIFLIKCINPKNVITLIDNSFDFFLIAKLMHNEKINFYAIQNSSRRNDIDIEKKRFIPNYFTFSNYEKKLFKQSKNVRNFFPIGSFKAEIAKQQISKKKFKKNIYDICLISEPEIFIDEFSKAKKIDKNLSLVFKHCLKFSNKFNKKIIIMGKSNIDDYYGKILETEFYKNFIPLKKFKIFFHNKKRFENYKIIFQSKVVIGATSTLLREAFAFKKKVLCCKYVKFTNGNNFATTGLSVLNKKSYEEFEKRLIKIQKMSYSNYLKSFNQIDQVYFTRTNVIQDLQNKFN